MAQRARIYCPGAVYHVMLRGNGGQGIFVEESDRIRFYEMLGERFKRFDVRIRARCLMRNHVQMVVQVAEIPISRLVRNVSLRYIRFRNAPKSIGQDIWLESGTRLL
jgi:putative transposase